MTEKTNAMRVLEGRKVRYEVLTFSSEFHSADEVAEILGLPQDEVYKTLVVLRPKGKPMLIMVAADKELDLKKVAQAVGEKKVHMALHREAEELTGLQVGGISALALLGRPFDVFIDRPATERASIVISAGQRGMDVRLAVPDLIRVTRARVIEAT